MPARILQGIFFRGLYGMRPSLTEIVRDRPLLLLGMGNPLRGDDAVGHLLAQSLERYNDECFTSRAVGTAVENAMSFIRAAAGGSLLLVDAVFDESLAEGDWQLYPTDRLDSVCHTTHSIPISLLISFWRREVQDIDIHFLGVGIRRCDEMAPLSPVIRRSLNTLNRLIIKAGNISDSCR
jgi:hydrogenase maturation protease